MADLSFVIPAYNETKFIDKCLSTIVELSKTNQLDTEIIVINNDSTDNTVALAKQHTSLIYSINRSSISTARNLGIEKASSELIAFIDADVVLTQAWFDCFLAHAAKYRKDLNFLTGFQYVVRPDGTWIEEHWFKNLKDTLLNGGNIITSKQMCDKIGGFDVNLKTGEDYDFCTRAIEAGVNYHEEPGYVAIHDGFPRDVKNFYRREYWHGEGDFLTLQIFLKSLVAILGVGYLFALAVIFILLIAGYYQLMFIAAFLLLGLNIAITIKRFSRLPVISIAYNSVLNFVYFYARGMSLFKALKNRSKAY